MESECWLSMDYHYCKCLTGLGTYNVVLFYHGLYENIKDIHPLAKFLSIKLVVFATFWQEVIVVLAVDVHFIGDTETYTSNQVSSGIQDFLICIEMFIAAVLHLWVWPPTEFSDAKGELPKLTRVLNPIDLLVDMHAHLVQPVISTVRKRKIQISATRSIDSDQADSTRIEETKITIESNEKSPMSMKSPISVEMASLSKKHESDTDSSDDDFDAIKSGGAIRDTSKRGPHPNTAPKPS